MGVCVSAAARGREAMAPPPPAACSAARGPPGRTHCSRPVSSRLARRPEPFRGSAPAPPSPQQPGPRGRLRSRRRTYPWACPRGPEVGDAGAGRGAPGRQPSFLPLGPGTGVGSGSPHGPTFLESRRLPRNICCCLREPRAHPGGGVGGGGVSVCSGCFAF